MSLTAGHKALLRLLARQAVREHLERQRQQKKAVPLPQTAKGAR